jgi:hypothetical protein
MCGKGAPCASQKHIGSVRPQGNHQATCARASRTPTLAYGTSRVASHDRRGDRSVRSQTLVEFPRQREFVFGHGSYDLNADALFSRNIVLT